MTEEDRQWLEERFAALQPAPQPLPPPATWMEWARRFSPRQALAALSIVAVIVRGGSITADLLAAAFGADVPAITQPRWEP